MDKFCCLYEQYAQYKKKVNEDDSGYTTNLLQYGITEDYFLKVNNAVDLLVKFYDTKLSNTTIRNVISTKINHSHADNVKFFLLIDVLRCYDWFYHPTTFTSSECIALMVLLDKVIGERKIVVFDQLGNVEPATLSLIDLVPYLSDCSEQLESRYSL